MISFQTFSRFNSSINESKFYAWSIQDYLNYLSSLNGTWIFFDLETSGFKAKQAQILEVAAISTTRSNFYWKEDDEFHFKITLNPATKELIRVQEFDKNFDGMSVEEILKMTSYGESRLNKNVEFEDEDLVSSLFVEWCESHSPYILAAHNAEFDIGFFNSRSYEKLAPARAIDTVTTANMFWLPLQLKLAEEGDERAIEIMKGLKKPRKSFGKEAYSIRLGDLASVLNVNASGWHSAIADVAMMIEVFNVMMSELEQWKDEDIEEQKRDFIIRWERLRRYVKKGKRL